MKAKANKIRNATKVEEDGIKFRSKLELYTYKALKKAGINAEYEPKHFEILPKFLYKLEKVRAMVYTPDFVGDNYIIECKGFANDAFPLRFKMFKYTLKDEKDPPDIYLVRNQKEVDNVITTIKNKQHGIN